MSSINVSCLSFSERRQPNCVGQSSIRPGAQSCEDKADLYRAPHGLFPVRGPGATAVLDPLAG